MSQWTYVTGAVTFDTYGRSDAESLYIAQTVAAHLPRITGSERDAALYVNLLKGHNASSTEDEFDRPSNLGAIRSDSGASMFEYQTRCVLTVTGSLRDRDVRTTARETARMLARLASKVGVDECAVTVSGTSNGQKARVTFDDPEWLRQIDLTDFAWKLTWDPDDPPVHAHRRKHHENHA